MFHDFFIKVHNRYFLKISYKKENLIHRVLYFLVTLQPFDFDPTEKNKHKFMVQAIVAPDFDDDEEFCDVVRNIVKS